MAHHPQFRNEPIVLGLAIGLLLIIGPYVRADDRPLSVRVDPDARRYFVGQEIRLTVRVVAEGKRPEIRAPKVDQTVPTVVGSSFRQLGASGIGNIVTEVNQYATIYSIVAPKAGKLTIPPFVARDTERTGASSPLELTVVSVPSEGRPASWLRGVGAIEARAQLGEKSVRLGQAVDFRLILKGAGALASTTAPRLDGFETGETELTVNPPERTFHYRLRPTKPGTFEIPGIEVATFDPKFQQFVRTRTPKLALEVVDIPPFDPASLDSQPAVQAATEEKSSRAPIFTAVIAGIPLVFGLAWVLVRWSRSPRSLAKRLARELAAVRGNRAAQAVAGAMSAFLHATTGWSGGEITPSETAEMLRTVLDDSELAERAAGLVERADRDRFGGGLELAEAELLAKDAAQLFVEIAAARFKRQAHQNTAGGSRNRESSG